MAAIEKNTIEVKIPRKLLDDMNSFIGDDKDFLDAQEMLREGARRMVDHLKNVEQQRKTHK